MFSPTIPLEQELGKQFYKALQGEIVEKILNSAIFEMMSADELRFFVVSHEVGFVQRNYVPSLESIS